MPKESYFPDTKEPHVHTHKGGADFTNTGHNHKKLQEGNLVRKANCEAVINDLKNGNAREKSIAAYIKTTFL